MDSFEQALAHVLKWETAAYTNDPADPGGETKFGISKKAFPDVEIASLTRETAASIYRVHYWNPLAADSLPPGLALLAFDCAVNQGLATARKLLRQTQDLTSFAARRAYEYALLDKLDDRFGLGWMNRLFDTYNLARRLETDHAAHPRFAF